jgi:outer membrane protein
MHVHRHAVTLAAGLLVSAAAPPLYAQATRIAVVDLQRAIHETEDGRRAQKRLKRLMTKRQQELNDATKSLKQAKKQLEAAWPTLTDEAKQRRQQELQEAYIELQSKYTEYQRELAQAEASATRDILERMQQILRRLGQREGYTLILERNEGGVVWAPANLDLTDRVIQEYERQDDE